MQLGSWQGNRERLGLGRITGKLDLEGQEIEEFFFFPLKILSFLSKIEASLSSETKRGILCFFVLWRV